MLLEICIPDLVGPVGMVTMAPFYELATDCVVRDPPGCTTVSHLACGCKPTSRGEHDPGLLFTLARYSTLDNVDGKQARRTGTSSGLGELFECAHL